MKKTLLVLSAILALSMAFVGCKKSSGSNEPDKSDPVNNEAGTEVNYLFKVADWKAANKDMEAAAVIEGDYLKVTLTETWNNLIFFPVAIPVSEGDVIKFKGYFAGDGVKYTINLMDASWKKLGEAVDKTNKEAEDIEITCKAGSVAFIQAFAQNTAGDTVPATLYVGSASK